MTKVNSNNENEAKPDIFKGKYSNLTPFFIKIFEQFLQLASFKFFCKSGHRQVKKNKIKWGIGKSDSIFPLLIKCTI